MSGLMGRVGDAIIAAGMGGGGGGTDDAPLTGHETKVDPAPKVEMMVCAACRFPVCQGNDIIPERFTSWKKAVYSYELELGDRKIWCYSATNAHDYRFDVTRIRPPVPPTHQPTADRIAYDGDPTEEHTWFPGYAWRMAHCRACQRHLGWGFSPVTPSPSPAVDAETASAPMHAAGTPTADSTLDDEQETTANEVAAEDGSGSPIPSVKFCGLVLTKLASVELTLAEVAEFDAKLAEISSHRPQYLQNMRAAIALLNSLPLALAGQFFTGLQAMEADPSQQVRSAEFLTGIEAVIHAQQANGIGMEFDAATPGPRLPPQPPHHGLNADGVVEPTFPDPEDDDNAWTTDDDGDTEGEEILSDDEAGEPGSDAVDSAPVAAADPEMEPALEVE